MIRLRPLVEADLPMLHRWRQDPALWTHLVGEFQPREETQAVAYMRRWLTPTPTELRLAIDSDGALIGQTALAPIAGPTAEFHIFLGDAARRGHGYGAAATRAMLSVAFDQLGLSRVTLEVLATNLTARRLYERLGFRVEGVSRKVEKRGVMTEVIAMSLSADQFDADVPSPLAGEGVSEADG
jgi:RimJ/RimL family protein N-acetyltransferase